MNLKQAIKNFETRVGVIGLGYVGLPLAITVALRGFPVTGFDVDQGKMDQLNAGKSYIGAVSDAELAQAVDNNRFNWTTDFVGLFRDHHLCSHAS